MKLAVALLLALTTAACASSGAIPKPFPGAPGATGVTGASGAAPVAPVAPVARVAPVALVQTAMGFRGVPYRNGGTDPSGFDCSGFVQYVFAQHGLALPREVREQFSFGDRIDVQDAQTGDLIFFSTVGKGPTHVGVVVGSDQFVHAPSSRGVVRVERFTAQYWAHRIVAVKRIN